MSSTSDGRRKAPAIIVSAGALGLLNSKALNQKLLPEAGALPKVSPPSLDGLEVAVSPRALREEDIDERIDYVARTLANRRARNPREPVSDGDDVCINILAYANGSLVPFSAKDGVWIALEMGESSPELAKKLVGVKVGDSVQFEARLPNEPEYGSLKGERAIYLVDVLAANELKPLKNDEFIRRFKRGKSLKDVRRAVRADLEREQHELLRFSSIRAVLNLLANQVEASISDEMIDEQITSMWRTAEAPILARKNFSSEEQQEALEGWLNHESSRADVRQRLKVTAVVAALAEQANLQAAREQMLELSESVAKSFKLSPEKLKELEAWKVPGQTLTNMTYLMTIEHIMRHVTVKSA